MKTIYSMLLLCFCCVGVKAGDTLTNRQVYNFSVGDTFDYRWHSSGNNGPYYFGGAGLWRYVITGVYFSVDSSMEIIVREIEYPVINHDTLIIVNLDSAYYFPHFTAGQETYPDSLFFGNPINSYQFSYSGGTTYFTVAENLGLVSTWKGFEVGLDDGSGENDTALVYFANSHEHYGTPYYVLNGSTSIHYTPIPETCAAWEAIYKDMNTEKITVREQIKTGNRIANFGHTYVEMLYSGYRAYSGILTLDSIMGYFRNDTVLQRAYFYHGLEDTVPFLTYDFKALDSTGSGLIDSVVVGDEWRTRWNFGGAFNSGYIEGVGGNAGLLPVQDTFMFIPPGDFSVDTIIYRGYLSCFTVCDTLLYPPAYFVDCGAITSVNNIPATFKVRVYPIINTGQVNIDFDEGNGTYRLHVWNTLGNEIYSNTLSSVANQISLGTISSGLYIWSIEGAEGAVQSGKIVVIK